MVFTRFISVNTEVSGYCCQKVGGVDTTHVLILLTMYSKHVKNNRIGDLSIDNSNKG